MPARFRKNLDSSEHSASKVLKWPELQVDAVYFDPAFVRNLTDCAGFLTGAFDTFLLYRPNMYFGGEGWHDHTCLSEVVHRYAAQKNLQLMVVGHCTWAMARDLMFLNQKWPMTRHVMHSGNMSATSVPAQA